MWKTSLTLAAGSHIWFARSSSADVSSCSVPSHKHHPPALIKRSHFLICTLLHRDFVTLLPGLAMFCPTVLPFSNSNFNTCNCNTTQEIQMKQGGPCCRRSLPFLIWLKSAAPSKTSMEVGTGTAFLVGNGSFQHAF
jgi:hypothetical protein